jgi:hypothetical protein
MEHETMPHRDKDYITYILCYQLRHTHLIRNATLQYSLQFS